MLKTQRQEKMWFVTQPDHAQVSGYLAAHWGNDEFARPGYFADSADPERLRAETVFGIAEHDNGWWEWDADPPLSAEDGLPQGLGEVLKNPVAGMERWRLSIPRLAERHPYASLLIGDHAYWLYAAQFDPDPPPEFTHHLLRGRPLYPKELETEARRFLADVREMQEAFRRHLEEDRFWRAALEPEHRNPHARLLQTLDSLSLALCSAVIAPVEGEAKGLGEDHVVFHDVPRRSWEDRVSIALKPLGDRRIACNPYPFDEDPLPILVRARIFDLPADHSTQFPTWWHSQPQQLIRFEYCSA